MIDHGREVILGHRDNLFNLIGLGHAPSEDHPLVESQNLDRTIREKRLESRFQTADIGRHVNHQDLLIARFILHGQRGHARLEARDPDLVGRRRCRVEHLRVLYEDAGDLKIETDVPTGIDQQVDLIAGLFLDLVADGNDLLAGQGRTGGQGKQGKQKSGPPD